MPLNQEDPIKELYVIGFTRSYGRTDWSEDLNIESSVDPKTNEEYDNRRIILYTIREIFISLRSKQKELPLDYIVCPNILMYTSNHKLLR